MEDLKSMGSCILIYYISQPMVLNKIFKAYNGWDKNNEVNG